MFHLTASLANVPLATFDDAQLWLRAHHSRRDILCDARHPGLDRMCVDLIDQSATRVPHHRNAWVNAPGVMGMHAGYEAFGAQADLDYFQERMRVEGEVWDITELAWPRDGEGSKIDRVQRSCPDIRRHRFYAGGGLRLQGLDPDQADRRK